MSEPVYVPSRQEIDACEMAAFSRFVERRSGVRFGGHADLHDFSIRFSVEFWALLLEWLDLEVEGDAEPARVGDTCEGALFFPNLRLNYVANLLRNRDEGDEGRLALLCWNEDGATQRISRGELTRRVLQLARGLAAIGVRPGTRVAAVARNTADAVVACLASTALGALWCSASTDLGHNALRDRFGQFEPELLFYHDRHRVGGSTTSIGDRLARLVTDLPGISATVALDEESVSLPGGQVAAFTLDDLAHRDADRGPFDIAALPRLPFNHPLFVLFSSGTTGAPKGIVHGAGGTLLEHQKEHRLHTGLGPDDLMYFQTNCGWMMWNWTLSALACRTAIALYDGVVVHPVPEAQLDLVSRDEVTVFGTSPSFLQVLGNRPQRKGGDTRLSALRLVLSTGSVLPPRLFTWVRDHLKQVPIHSISGGTDLIGCFLLGNPTLPVHAGELQSRSLGYDVATVPTDPPLAVGAGVVEAGELVCRNPFPSRPLGLLNDPDGSRFHQAYFSRHDGVWTHGDLLEFTSRGGARLLGRHDGVLNVGGIRIGPAEIARALESVEEIREAVAVEQRIAANSGGSRLVLVVVPRNGALDRSLAARIRRELMERCSAAHVPAVIVPVPELPVTHNGKRSDRAVRDAVNGNPIVNLEALRNPGAIDAIRGHPALQDPTPSSSGRTGVQGDPLEKVREIWQSVLGGPVEPDDVFFESGGDSLRGLYLLNDIEQAFDVRLPMSSLLISAATPAGMAELLAANLEGHPRSTVVPLRRSGKGRPLFWIPGGGMMSVLAYREVSQLLDERPVYGLEARLDGEPSGSLPELATEFVEAVIATDPDGPHFLFGFSAGAFVAFEMARQLSERGRPPALLVLFDAHLPVRHSFSQKIAVATQRASCHASRMAEIPVRQWGPYLKGVLAMVEKTIRQRIAPGRAPSWRSEIGQHSGEQTAFDMRDAHNRALVARYRSGVLPKLDARVAIVLARNTSWSSVNPSLDPRLAWRKHLRTDAEVIYVPGSHLSMLESPNVEELGAALRALVTRTEQAMGSRADA